MRNLECISDLVGLSRNTVGGITPPATAVYFVDEITGISSCFQFETGDCSDGNIWDRLKKCLVTAQTQLYQDFGAMLRSRWESSIAIFNGFVGQDTFSAALATSETTAKLTIKTRMVSGVVLKVLNVGVVVNQTVTVTMTAKRNGVAITGANYTIAAQASKRTGNQLIDPLELACDGSEYEFSFPLTGGLLPMNNQISCNCNAREMPLFPILDWKQDNAMGVSLICTTECDLTGLMCLMRLYADLKLVIASTVAYRAIMFLIQDVLSSGQVNRYTLLDNEVMMTRYKYFEVEYLKNVQWLTEQQVNTQLTCYTCKPAIRMIRAGIFNT